LYGRARVRLEEAGVDLAKYITDGFGFIGKFYGKSILELGRQVGYYIHT
jgi:hypothetical protein